MARGRPARATVYGRLDHALAELTTRHGGLPPPKEAEYIWSEIWHLEAHHSTALEGNTLVLREVAALLDQGKAVGSKPLREYMEVKGYGDAAHWVYAQALEPHGWTDGNLLTVQEVRQVHYLAMTPVWDVAPHPDATSAERPGNFRKHNIHPFPAGMTPPEWPLLRAGLDEWISTVNDASATIAARTTGQPLPELLAAVHNAFERLHPFLDGNGRAGRLLLNLILVRLGYPPVIVLKRDRERYLRCMHQADIGEFGPLGELLARGMIDNLNRFILPGIAVPAKLVPIAALVDRDVSMLALRAAARRGRLDSHQDTQGQWLSTRHAVDAYKRSRQHRGRGDKQ